jgi:hypothetical protein
VSRWCAGSRARAGGQPGLGRRIVTIASSLNGDDVSAVGGLRNRRDQPLEVHPVIDVDGLPGLVPHRPRELVSDDALNLRGVVRRRIVEDDVACVTGCFRLQAAHDPAFSRA